MDKQHVCRFLIITLAVLLAASAAAIEKQSGDRLLAGRYSLAGIRLGGWIDEGEASSSDTANIPESGFYTELFYDHRFTPALLLEFSFGIASRGDAEYHFEDDVYIGPLNLYTVLLQAKISPLSGHVRRFLPFLIAGGGFTVGRQSVDVVRATGGYWDPELVSPTETSLTGVFGGGIDWALSDQIGLNFTSKYHTIHFGDKLIGISDYSGLAVSVGVAYFLHSK